METIRQFEKNRQRANAYCPCGKNNRKGRFATERGYVGQPYGHCFDCGQDFWSGDDILVKPYEVTELPQFCEPCIDELINNVDSNLESGFIQFLTNTFSERDAIDVVEKYYLGVYDMDVIFWQIDINKNLRAGKVIAYDSEGKRRKDVKPPVRWWHKIVKSDCQLNQCLFGEHLIGESNKPIAVVESEKTACILSICNPAFTWVACGSKTNLQDYKCELLSGYHVTLFPDEGCYDEWSVIASSWGFNISRDCEIWYEQGMIEKSDDIADYYLKLQAEVKASKIDPEWSQVEYDSIFNPDRGILDSLRDDSNQNAESSDVPF